MDNYNNRRNNLATHIYNKYLHESTTPTNFNSFKKNNVILFKNNVNAFLRVPPYHFFHEIAIPLSDLFPNNLAHAAAFIEKVHNVNRNNNPHRLRLDIRLLDQTHRDRGVKVYIYITRADFNKFVLFSAIRPKTP